MIAASAVLTVAAAVLFVIGLFVDGNSMIYASIGTSLAALTTLIIGVLQNRKTAPTFGGDGQGEVPSEPAMRMVDESPVTAQHESLVEPVTPGWAAEPADEVAETEAASTMGPAGEMPARAPRARTTARKPAAKTAARKPAAKTAARKAAAKTATPKAAARKPAAKTAARKTAAKKAAPKTAARKPAARKPAG
ncbi:MAG: hypothetical protein ABR552_10705, partial [Actinomycetota bacterium]